MGEKLCLKMEKLTIEEFEKLSDEEQNNYLDNINLNKTGGKNGNTDRRSKSLWR